MHVDIKATVFFTETVDNHYCEVLNCVEIAAKYSLIFNGVLSFKLLVFLKSLKSSTKV